MKPWHDYTHTIASIAQSFVSVCQQSMNADQMIAWANEELTPNDCMDANLVLDGIIENHGVQLWTDGHMTEAAISFFNSCFAAASQLNKQLTRQPA
jgi:hypothetical protein